MLIISNSLLHEYFNILHCSDLIFREKRDHKHNYLLFAIHLQFSDIFLQLSLLSIFVDDHFREIFLTIRFNRWKFCDAIFPADYFSRKKAKSTEFAKIIHPEINLGKVYSILPVTGKEKFPWNYFVVSQRHKFYERTNIIKPDSYDPQIFSSKLNRCLQVDSF